MKEQAVERNPFTGEVESTTVATTGNNQPSAFSFDDEGFNVSVDLTSRQVSFCSMIPKTEDEKVLLYNAMNNPEKRLSDCANMTLTIRDVYVEVVECTNEETGVTTKCPRIVLIDVKGTSYQCVSIGIYSALKKAIQVFGAPTWKNGVKFEVKTITKGSRKMLTLNVVK